MWAAGQVELLSRQQRRGEGFSENTTSAASAGGAWRPPQVFGWADPEYDPRVTSRSHLATLSCKCHGKDVCANGKCVGKQLASENFECEIGQLSVTDA